MTPISRRRLLGLGVAASVADAFGAEPLKNREIIRIKGTLIDSGTERDMTHLLIDAPEGVYHYTGNTRSLRYQHIPGVGNEITVEGSYRGRCQERRLFPVLKDPKYRARQVYELGPIRL